MKKDQDRRRSIAEYLAVLRKEIDRNRDRNPRKYRTAIRLLAWVSELEDQWN